MPVRKFLSHLGNWSDWSGPLHARLSRGYSVGDPAWADHARQPVASGARYWRRLKPSAGLRSSLHTRRCSKRLGLRAAGQWHFRMYRSTWSKCDRRDGIDGQILLSICSEETSDVIDMTIGCCISSHELPKSLFRLPATTHALIMDACTIRGDFWRCGKP